MPVSVYRWPAVQQFRNRVAELAVLEAWWRGRDMEPVNLYGRRRVGKSWLFRKFAHGKPAVILVADRVAPGQQLDSLAAQLEPALGVVPRLDDVAALFRVLFSLAKTRKVLAVVDEFPYLLGTTVAEQQACLSAIQAVLEQERDGSKLKLVLTGSTVAQMAALQEERSPLHGRLVPLAVSPLDFVAARPLLDTPDVVDALTRYSVTGGMPRYLHALAGEDLLGAVADRVVDRYGALFNEPRTLLQTELREPAVYFSVLTQLAGHPQSASAMAAALRMTSGELSRYLVALESLRLVSRRLPVGAKPDARTTQWRCEDHFVRFWFRFVAPYQAELDAGADARAHVDLVVAPNLADHTAPAFEQALTSWTRQVYAGRASAVATWWGPSLHALRATRTRFTEEIDTVAVHGRTVVAAGEAKWTNKPMPTSVLTSLREHKLPALEQSGFTVAGCEIVLTSRSGFADGLRDLAATDPSVRLVDAVTLLADLR